MQAVNLRAVGTDPANPTAGTLVGTADIEDRRVTPTLLTTAYDDKSQLRLFVLAPQSFFGEAPTLEYIETIPTSVSVRSA
jgi:hypothetical protein